MSNQVRFFVFDDPTRQRATALPVEVTVSDTMHYNYASSIFLSVPDSQNQVARFVIADLPSEEIEETGSVITVFLARIEQWPFFSEPERFAQMRQTNG